MTESASISPAEQDRNGLLSQRDSGTSLPRIWALIPCAGTGARAAGAQPKQYRDIAGQALVLHTLAAFVAVPRVARTLVVVAAADDFFAGLAKPLHASCRPVSRGGPTRAQTVSNGLTALLEQGAAEHDWVLVHDAARCLVTPDLINRLIDACLGDPVGGLLAHPVPDTLKLGLRGVDCDRVAATADRTRHWLAQTPQMFRIGVLRAALRAAGERVTDESAAIEAFGLSPRLVSGSASNFKITYPEDFALAQSVLRGRGRGAARDLDYEYP